jgi:fucose 4-O-acetylase-like acetyltransferase
MTNSDGRLVAIDSARGIGILLVVFGHAWRGARGAGLLPDGAIFRSVDFTVYAFHMPLFFFLSGLLFLETLQKYPLAPLLRGRLTRLLWPMALWSWIFFGMKLAAGQAVNNPVTLSDFPLIPVPPYEHLWFLWALFLCQCLLVVVFSVARGAAFSAQLWRWSAGGLAVLGAVANPYLPVPSLVWGPMVEHLPYFLAGIALGGVLALQPSRLIGVLCGAGFVFLLWAVHTDKASVLHSLALVVLFWGGWLCLDRGATGSFLAMLRALGEASMVIYLTHTIFTASLRIALVEGGVDHPAIVIGATTLIGVCAPLAVLWGARRLRVVKLLGF